MGAASVSALQKVYESPKDIDLYSGMLSEPRVSGGMVGELCAHILAAQFHRLRDCDRFWYENGRQKGSFSTKQLKSLRQTSLAKIVCDHVDKASEIGAKAFEVPSSILFSKYSIAKTLDSISSSGRKRSCNASRRSRCEV